ncbi:hypothetical protein AGMMS49921_02380 [Endomicrobiia bacterium]|nr:hypothetical protein AGMMS49921_02380 [Endomicrobiia bacterium]
MYQLTHFSNADFSDADTWRIPYNDVSFNSYFLSVPGIITPQIDSIRVAVWRKNGKNSSPKYTRALKFKKDISDNDGFVKWVVDKDSNPSKPK